MIIYVVAGTYRQADHWIRSEGLSYHEARYVDRPDRLYGAPRFMKFVKVGTWYESPHAAEIASQLAAREAVELPANAVLSGAATETTTECGASPRPHRTRG